MLVIEEFIIIQPTVICASYIKLHLLDVNIRNEDASDRMGEAVQQRRKDSNGVAAFA